MKQVFMALIFIAYFLSSGCAEMLYDATENKKHGQTYDEYENEQAKKDEQWRLHQKIYE
jgi:hypothetical protein